MARKQKKYHYIYKTTNLLSGKYYIGMHSTSDLEDGYQGSGKRLRYSINKYGAENHKVEILEYLNSREELTKREKEIVNLNEIAKKDCMNLMVGGTGGFISVEQQRMRSIAGVEGYRKKLKEDPIFYEQHCARQRVRFIKLNKNKTHFAFFTGKKHTQETKDKIGKANSIKQKGFNNSQYGTCWITNEKESKKIYKGDLIPKGWRLGRKI